MHSITYYLYISSIFFLSQSEQYEYESHVFASYYENGQIHFLQSICEKQPV